jgi:hypothetical protein
MKQLNNLLSVFSAKPLMLLFFFTLLPNMASAQCPDNNHPHMIDLGLPSGTKWACCNVGASKPEDFGGYYAWGETEEKSSYTPQNYLDGKGESYFLGNDIAGTDYDVAHVKWRGSWVMPNEKQMNELTQECASEWTTENGVNGRRFTGPNGVSIFLPASGIYYYDILTEAGSTSCYWQSLDFSNPDSHYRSLWFTSETLGVSSLSRYYGVSVRPVATASSTPSGIAIDENNFPDENFRNWVLAQDYGKDGVLTEDEIAIVTEIDVSRMDIADLTGIEYFTALTGLQCENNQLTSIDVSKNTALKELNCNWNQLTSLDVSKNTALERLNCNVNPLTSLDVTKNTALTTLKCGGTRNNLTTLDVTQNTALTKLDCQLNKLTSLNLSKNAALKELNCGSNQLTSLDVSQNTALEYLFCYDNQLTSLDVSKNTALRWLMCYSNQLTSLDVSKNTALTDVQCYNNCIKGASMDALIAGLHSETWQFGRLDAINNYFFTEQNVVTKAQVAVAKEKGWTTYYWNFETENWEEYEGSESEAVEIQPVDQGESVDIGNEIDENTNLDGNVVGDVYYCISSGDGSYDPEEGCLVVTKPTEDSAIDGKDIFGEDFKAGYTGFMFMVAPGKGTIKVEAQTIGNMVLKVKVGDNAPAQMEVNGKTKVSFSYDVSEPTMVFIYGSIAAASAKGMRKVSGTDMLKIYGIEVTSETDGIEDIKNERLKMNNSPVYNLNGQRVESSMFKVQNSKLPKGVYIQNGKKVLVK